MSKRISILQTNVKTKIAWEWLCNYFFMIKLIKSIY